MWQKAPEVQSTYEQLQGLLLKNTSKVTEINDQHQNRALKVLSQRVHQICWSQVHLWSRQPLLSFSQIHVLFQCKGKSAQELCKVKFLLPTRKQGWGYGVLSNSWTRLDQGKMKVKGRIVKESPGPLRSVITVITLTAGVHPCGTCRSCWKEELFVSTLSSC